MLLYIIPAVLYSSTQVEVSKIPIDQTPSKSIFPSARDPVAGMVRIFRNQRILDTDYVPEVLIGRDDQIAVVARVFDSIFQTTENGEPGKPGHLFIYGPPGSGKTTVLSYVFRRLYADAETCGKFPNGLKYLDITVSCKRQNTKVRMFIHLINKLVEYLDLKDFKIPKRGVTADFYYDLLCKLLRQFGGSITVIFDEVDFLCDDDILYHLSRAGEFKDLNPGQYIHIVGVSNSGNFIKNLDPRVDSSMQRESIIFQPYNESQLIEILNMRVPLAFCPGVLEPDVVPMCAKEAAKDEGDCRRAIYLLKTAGTIATSDSHYKVQSAHVVMAMLKIKEDISLEYVGIMTYSDKFTLLAMLYADTYCKQVDRLNKNNSYFITGDVYRIYRDMCSFIGEAPSTLAALSKKIPRFHMMGVITADPTSKGRGGKTSQIVFNGDTAALKRSVLEDSNFVKFKEYNPSVILRILNRK